VDDRLARQLRAAGHLVYLPWELGKEGQPDEDHLATAVDLGSVLVTHNQKHFAPLHRRWESEGRSHAGIILVVQQQPIGTKLASLDRAARLLTPDVARGQLIYLQVFESDERASIFLDSFIPPVS
jgi:hypothetical protein